MNTPRAARSTGQPGAFRRRVGSVRPSHLMFTTGVGALADLPNFSVLIKGLDDWRYDTVPDWSPVVESRLLSAVRYFAGQTVEELRPAPWMSGTDSDPGGPAARIGVPTMPFPTWLRCTACNQLAPIDSRAFGFANDRPRRPQDAHFSHTNCPRRRSRPLAVAARFVLTCTNGHLDDFPYVTFTHHGGDCAQATHPTLSMEDRGGNLGANVEISCLSCGEHRNIRDALGRRGRDNLPRCRGRHPHLSWFDPRGCAAEARLLIVGASNQWFADTLSVLYVPPTGAAALADRVRDSWSSLDGISVKEVLSYARGNVPALRTFAQWTDDELWDAIEAERASRAGGGTEERNGYPDLRTPEWEVFADVRLPDPDEDFAARRVPVPAPLKDVFADVIQVERLREVRALIGFTRLDAPDPEDPDLVERVPLARDRPTWVPASEVRGEGIFFRVPEDALRDWERRVADSAELGKHKAAYRQFRRNRYSDRITSDFDETYNWPGKRYLALHTLSHLLIRTVSLECGYNSASLSERIYAGDEDDPRGGILIYTAVPDAEGTLGGLVALAEPESLERLTRRALADARHCSSDPLCAERLPESPADFLHGAACHVCLFVSETTCEHGNRFLDRRFVVPVDKPELALFPELP